jgi:hypothetical protein
MSIAEYYVALGISNEAFLTRESTFFSNELLIFRPATFTRAKSYQFYKRKWRFEFCYCILLLTPRGDSQQQEMEGFLWRSV